jgi:hypothetical protein
MRAIRLRMALLATLVVVLAASGCARPSPEPAAKPPQVAAVSTSADPNLHPCVSIEAIFARLRSPLASWNPGAQPFDRTVAAKLHNAATDVQQQEVTATGQTKQAVHELATALVSLVAAMEGKDAAAVKADATAVRTSFTQLKDVCKIGD